MRIAMTPLPIILVLLLLLHVCSSLRRCQAAKQVSTRGCARGSINRADFPILSTEAYPGKPLVYLDSAASSQKPLCVLEEMDSYYKTSHANVHRGAHSLAVKATEKYERARDQVRAFVNARQREEIIFTRGATEAINIVAMSYGQQLRAGDEILLSVMEHHSNLVPWQLLAQRSGAVLRFVNVDPQRMVLDMDHFRSLLSDKTKLVAVSHASNVLGAVNPVGEVISLAHSYGAKVLLDACQSVPHMPVDVQALDVDFLAASGHKMCGPTGIGFLYAKHDLLLSMAPVYGGGEMINKVELQASTYALPPSRFEAGTPAIAEAVGLGRACDYLRGIGMDRIYEHEKVLGRYLYSQLQGVPGVRVLGPASSLSVERTGLVAFTVDGLHTSDLAFFLDQEGVAVRSGHHCTQPLHALLGLSSSARASLYFYNDEADVDALVKALRQTIAMFEEMRDVQPIL